jgi:2-(3-amino-3-carboxypropyl)histidine synthase
MTLNFELDKLKSELLARAPKKVLVQLPEGVKQNAFEIRKVIEELGIEVIFSGETVWGGCALAVREAKEVGADLIVHFGHAKFIESEFPILYMEIKDDLDLKPILEKSLEAIKNYKKLGLSYAVQHRYDIDSVVKFYEENGKEIVMSEKKGYAAYPGHVVGCEFGGLKTIQDSVEAFLVLGNNFHSMGAAIAVEKPVFLLDVYNDAVTEMEGVRDKIIRQRIISIEKVRDVGKIGIISEVKLGQKFGSAAILKEKLEKLGKEVILIAMDEMMPDKLMNFYDVDAFVELGCPRIAIDDFAKYSKPIITYKEALVVAGEIKIEELIEKGFI